MMFGKSLPNVKKETTNDIVFMTTYLDKNLIVEIITRMSVDMYTHRSAVRHLMLDVLRHIRMSHSTVKDI